MLIALDTNVPIDLVKGREEVLEGIGIIQGKCPGARLIVPPTVLLELEWLSEFADDEAVREATLIALDQLERAWAVERHYEIPLLNVFVPTIAARFHFNGLLPYEERNDAAILAESVLLGCSMLLSSDRHLRSIDHDELSRCLMDLPGFTGVGPFKVQVPVIRAPSDLVRRFSGGR